MPAALPSALPVATLSLFRFDGLGSRLWVIRQMALARIALRRSGGPAFWKLCGSGTGEGFTPRPNWAVWAILAVWPDRAAASAGVAGHPVWRRWRAHAAEGCTIHLSALSARGAWGGVAPFQTGPDPGVGPLAVLTRASVRPSRALRFWRRVPDISAVIGRDPDVLFKVGIGEVPFLNQITFSIWPDAGTMSRFAHGDGPHGRAIRAVREEGWFTDELYARFRVLEVEGNWNGTPMEAMVADHATKLSPPAAKGGGDALAASLPGAPSGVWPEPAHCPWPSPTPNPAA